MEAIELLIQATDNIAILICLGWILSERRDNKALFSIVQSLTMLRLRQIDDNSDSVLIELE